MNWERLLPRLMQYLCPPGDGVYTVISEHGKQAALQKSIYAETGPKVKVAWAESLQNLPKVDAPIILGLCSDTGGGIMRGANWGPLFVREAMYECDKDISAFELGDVRVIPQLLLDKYLNQETIAHCREALYGDANTDLAVSPLSIAQDVAKNLNAVFPNKLKQNSSNLTAHIYP